MTDWTNSNSQQSKLGFSTDTLLANGATYDSGILSLVNYTQVQTSVLSTGASGTITIEFHEKADGSSVLRTLNVPYVDGSGFSSLSSLAFTPYVRYQFTATTAGQTKFYFDTKFTTTALNGQVLGVDDFISTTMVASLGRNVLVGRTHGGLFKNVPVDSEGHLHTDIPTTAFGDVRTAELSPIFQNSFEYTVTNTEIGNIEVAGSGAVTQADAMLVCTTGATTGSTAEWESAHNAKYRAGLGGLFRGTAMFTTGVDGTEQALGLTDAEGSNASFENGYAVGYSGTTFGFLRWQNDVLITVAQADWDDPMDGTGPSGMTLDPTKLNVYFIQFQYLGAGAIVLWVESDTTGRMVKAHTIQYANQNIVPSVYMPNFHPMLHVLNGTTTSNIVAKSASMAYFIEGKSKFLELQQPTFTSERRTKTSVTTEVAIFTIRNKTNYAAKLNHIDIVLAGLSSSIEAGANNNLGAVRVVKNATLGGTPSWTDIQATNSVCEIDTAGTTVTGGTTLLDSDLAGKNDRAAANLLGYEIIISPGSTITVAGLSAASATFKASLLWKELF